MVNYPQDGFTKGRVDIVLEKNDIGLIIEMKYNGSAEEALKQAHTYKKLIEGCKTKVYVGCNVSSDPEVSLLHKIESDVIEDSISFSGVIVKSCVWGKLSGIF